MRIARLAEELGLIARAHDRCLTVARTFANLKGHPQVEINGMAEAIGYSLLDRLTTWEPVGDWSMRMVKSIAVPKRH